MVISYELSQDLKTSDREAYNFLDWVGDLGGLFDGLKIGFTAVLVVLNYKMYDTYMVSKLFTVRSENRSDQQGGPENNKIKRALTEYFTKDVNKKGKEQLDPNRLSSLKMLLFDLIPRWCKNRLTNSKCGPLARTQRYKYFENGLKDYEDEINIVEVLRNLRYYNAAVKKLLKN